MALRQRSGQAPSRSSGQTPRRPAREAALALVAKRLLSVSELRTRLQRKGYEGEEIDDAVALVKSYGYVDDTAVAQAVQREAERTARGPRWVESTLKRRGISEALCQQAADACGAIAEELARRALRARYGEPAELTDKQRERAYQYLLRRGFDIDCAASILEGYA